MKLSHKSYFKSELRVRVRRILRIRSEEGNALFEFAMVLPLLSMLLVGIIYCGITFYDYVTLADAVAIGARTIVTNRGAGTGPPTACALGETALDNAATSLKTSLITIDSGAGTETFTGTGGSTCNALVAGDYVTVTAKYPCSLTIPFAGINLCPIQGSGGSFISSSTTMRIE
jgi:Flp pilus assembly protein TadG